MEPKPEVNKDQQDDRSLCTNTSHDPFIDKFPPEIVSHIFLLSMKNRGLERAVNWLPTQFTLGSVSRAWRQVAWSTPQLWTTISFTLAKPPKKIQVKDVLQIVNDWLRRSHSLPLDIFVYNYSGDKRPISQAQCGPIINALNQQSGRWNELYLGLANPSFYRLFCGASASTPTTLRSLHLETVFSNFSSPTFKMKSRPSPKHLFVKMFPLSNIDIMWDKLETFNAWLTNLISCIEVMERASHLHTCSLSAILTSGNSSMLPTTVVRHTRLRKLELFKSPVSVLIEFLKILELPSLEDYFYQSEEGDILANSLVALLNRSVCHLKVITLRLEDDAPAMADFNKVLNAVPYLEKLRLDLLDEGPKTAFIMDDLFTQLSSSPPSVEGDVGGLLPNLRTLELYSGEGYMFECIPEIFSLPHRKMLSLKVDGRRSVVLDDETLEKISNLIEEGFEIRILQNGEDYFSRRSLSY
ncbi:hypothetical protein M413DRAFT_443818 [Hebeloma cylindrosporum]|uniref:Uncharacterized protein n=1 Tax=Hebeloma cylindrosporum TaxID=76867 RepID=A0A0C3CFR2_HEBCY|nr:hypothetical protein M413DRAFT_443818 [Hebeloma cylindrosporum h7]